MIALSSWGHRGGNKVVKGRARYVLYAVIVIGLMVVAHLGSSLAILASAPMAQDAALVRAKSASGDGTLLICGGGTLPDSIRDRFVELAGGREARIVVIPTAAGPQNSMARGELSLVPWKSRRVRSLQLLHAQDKSDVSNPEFVRPLEGATGVWINGGSQSWLSLYYAGTAVEKQLQALLDRGGVIGGTSAGAAIMSRVMIARGRDRAEIERGFDLLPGVVIDQHFLKRNRMTRLAGAVEMHPDLIGLGIDEGTAVEVDVRHHSLSVLGASYAVACVPEDDPKGPRIHTDYLKSGDKADLSALRSHSPHSVIPGLPGDVFE